MHIMSALVATLMTQGRRRRSGRSGHGRTTFLAENGFGRTTIFDYSAENVLAFSTVLKCDDSIDTKRT